jgi:hypothetical protein
MNVQLKDITVTARDGRVSHLEQVYIRGSHVRYFIVPDMLRCAYPTGERNQGILTPAGMRPCSDLEAPEEEVSVLRAAVPRSTGLGERGVVDERLRRREETLHTEVGLYA